MPQVSTVKSTRRATAIVADEQQALMRGVAHGVILSMVIWTAALYLTFVLR